MKKNTTVILILSLWLTGTTLLAGSAVAQHAGHDWDSRGNPHGADQGRMHNRMRAPRGSGCEMPGHGMKKGGGIGALLRNAEELKLSDSQKDQLENLRFDFQMARIDQEAAIKKAHAKLNRLKQDGNAPEVEVMEAIDLAAGAKAEMEKMQYSHRREIMASLTDDQRDKLKQLRLEKRSRSDGDQMKGKLGKKRKPRPRSGG